MLRKERYQTKFLYSDEIYNRLIDKNSLLERINQEFDFSCINEEVKDDYCEDGFNLYDFILSNDCNCLTYPNGITVGSSGKISLFFL